MSTVKIYGTIGPDSRSGEAYMFTTDDATADWIPYSVTKTRHVTKTIGRDSVEIEKWFADKNEIEYDSDSYRT